ncbi:hypothetical protein [Hymenobacter sp. BT730]|uniref:hypothetical protein n=1 Tax=Hymenobacter sp. BT730 TaxID=3063332 RepID=UPI0026E08D18|nr:hypothetical protein [Hymenobacter sp. BT730]
MAITPPLVEPDENEDFAAQAAQGKQAGSAVGQSSGRPSYGAGGYELNLDAEAGDEGGSGSAASTNERTSREETSDSE